MKSEDTTKVYDTAMVLVLLQQHELSVTPS